MFIYPRSKTGRMVCRCVLPALFAVLVWGVFNDVRAGNNFMIKKNACASGDFVRFGDIADPASQAGKAVWAEVKNRKLWKTPENKRRIAFNRGQLQRIMAEKAPDLADHCLYPRELLLQQGNKVLGPDDLQSMVVKFLTPYIKDRGEEIEFREFRLPEAVFMPNDADEVVLEKGSSEIEPGRNSFRIKVRDGYGDVRNSYTGSVFIDVWKTVPCSARPINRREPITMDAVRFERKNLAYIRGGIWDGKTGKWMASRSMGVGQCLTKKYLDPLPVLKRGEKVDLVYEGDFVRLMVPVEVLADAGSGDTVKVLNLRSDKEITARVRDSGTVVVR
ncbi:MAG: flagellar basal body P-ring formation chaperone FlgA [Thermodesulfobacteriota bacterium]